MEILLIGIDPSPYDYQHQRSIPWNLDLQRQRLPDFFDDGGPLGSACLAPADQRAAGLSVSGGKKCVKSSDPAGYIPKICWRNFWTGCIWLYWDAHDCSSTHLFGWRNMIQPIRTGCSSTHWGLGAMMILAGHSYVAMWSNVHVLSPVLVAQIIP